MNKQVKLDNTSFQEQLPIFGPKEFRNIIFPSVQCPMRALFWDESYFRNMCIKVGLAKPSIKIHFALKYFTKYFYDYTFAQGVPKN